MWDGLGREWAGSGTPLNHERTCRAEGGEEWAPVLLFSVQGLLCFARLCCWLGNEERRPKLDDMSGAGVPGGFLHHLFKQPTLHPEEMKTSISTELRGSSTPDPPR